MEYNTQLNRLKLVRESEQPVSHYKISSPIALEEWVRSMWDDDITIHETFLVGFLNNSNETLGWMKISQGGITGTVVDIRLIAKGAIDTLATSVVLAHNHPSGNLRPSEADKQLTKKIVKGLKLLDIRVTDHIIITKDSAYSFNNEGLL